MDISSESGSVGRRSGRQKVRLEKDTLNTAVVRRVAKGTSCLAIMVKDKIIRFSQVRWVLPQALRTLVPRRIVVNGIATSKDGGLAAARLPGKADARLQGSLVQFDANSPVSVNTYGAAAY